jgi:Flp pilus assembly protein TadB
MNLVNLLTACAFVCAILAGVMYFIVQDMRSTRPHARIRTRMEESFSFEGHGARLKDAAHFDKDLFSVTQKENALHHWFGPKISRLKTVAGANGLRFVIGAAIVGELVALAMIRFMPLPDFSRPCLALGLPVLCLAQTYRFLVERFRKRFLDGFPEVIDMIVRAVRAGVPVTQVIGSAAAECREPLKTEFKRMSDSLQVGLDLEEVLVVAMRRIEIADFSFFCVCLLLQRETGGQLGETLENLAGIVRTRREIRLKTRALTGEARITTKILAAIPVVIMASMYVLNYDYLMVLFNTESGNKLLTFGAISIVMGVLVINKMSKLDTSR